MKVELKNVKLNMAFSEETICFKADLYIDGESVAYASNDGRGGCTNYCVYSLKMLPLLQSTENYYKTLPSTFHTFGDKTLEIKSSLENWIDEEISNISNKKENERFKKRMDKDMLNCIIYGTNSSYTRVSWKLTNIEQMLSSPTGRHTLLSKIKELRAKGETILNTNIPQEILELS
jgi:hypothetical protein